MNSSQVPNNSENHSSDLVLKNIYFSWPGGKKALIDCNFSLPGSGLWMLVGSNGSGKSTFFKLISGMIQAQKGYFSCNLKPALMFQNPDHQLLLPSCGSDLLLSLPPKLNSKERRESIRNALHQVGMSGMESRPNHTLSGGQKQRLALAGALLSEANLLLLDEPTALLDPVSQKKILLLVKSLCNHSQKSITALWITHRLEELVFCEAAARMHEGQIGSWHSGDLLNQQLKALAVMQG